MDCSKVGKLIYTLRKEKNLTQKALADALHLSDRTISKWERGSGCPDVSLLPTLSGLFGVNIEAMLLGDLDPNDANGGNMKRIKFFMCPNCGNILTGTGEAEIYCCGRKLDALAAKPPDAEHAIDLREVEDEHYLVMRHDMDKAHYISFVAIAAYDRVLMIKLYPEQDAALRIPRMRGGTLYVGCTKHGLWTLPLK